MKMKEVCEKTGLTDRAVRLYIENGLVSPRYNESYAGRRNIDFSDTDVDILKEIATLRKASFSIAEIRALKADPDRATEILKTVTDNTQKRITADTEILSCLMPLLEKDGIGIEDICRSLNNPVIEKTQVPKEDMEAPLFIRVFKNVFKIVSVLAILLNTVNIVNIFSKGLAGRESVLYPNYKDIICVCILFAFSIFSALYFLVPRKKKEVISKGFLVKKSVLSTTFIAVLVLITYVTSMWSVLFRFGVEIRSETTKTENYMVFDDLKAKEALSEFLPERLPEAVRTEYKYLYTDYSGTGAPYENQTDVFLELELYGEAFESIVEYYKSFRPKDSKREPRTIDMGQYWTVICYREDNEEAPSNYTAFFAYSEAREEVRFICSYGNVSIKGAGIAKYILDDYKW